MISHQNMKKSAEKKYQREKYIFELKFSFK